MKDIIHPINCISQALDISYVANMKLDFITFILFPHIILFLFISRKDAYFSNISFQKPIKYSISKTARSSGDEKFLTCKNAHFSNPPISIFFTFSKSDNKSIF
ncbi:hypothetical protein HMPREF0262_00020 [Clostridium sp. ATCC 29733]|nr:hypothetical protein HMPREF0262_00020 [Clostridium sp. ATCC 29733]